MRKEKTITLDDRGNKLTFKIREMSALQLESWLLRAGLLLASTGAFDGKEVQTPSEAIQKAGSALLKGGISTLAQIDYEKAKPLLDELLECCSRTDAGIEQKLTPDTIDTIIEDIRTLFALRKEVLLLNLGFFLNANPSKDQAETTQSQAQSKPKILVHSPH